MAPIPVVCLSGGPSGTGFSPSELLYGQKVRELLQMAKETWKRKEGQARPDEGAGFREPLPIPSAPKIILSPAFYTSSISVRTENVTAPSFYCKQIVSSVAKAFFSFLTLRIVSYEILMPGHTGSLCEPCFLDYTPVKQLVS